MDAKKIWSFARPALITVIVIVAAMQANQWLESYKAKKAAKTTTTV